MTALSLLGWMLAVGFGTLYVLERSLRRLHERMSASWKADAFDGLKREQELIEGFRSFVNQYGELRERPIQNSEEKPN
jgi:hypothetical protein